VIDRFLSPEAIPCQAEQEIGVARRSSFDQARDSREWRKYADQNVNVISHDDIRVDFHELLVTHISQCRHDAICHARVPEPDGTVHCVIEFAIQVAESFARLFLRGDAPNMLREGALETPG
jgi:hypothetical protein